jgi:UDP-N-acetylglucosamine:LPS N-acetylglucosamine transferase
MLKVLAVSSVGGHLSELMQVLPCLGKVRVSLVINDRADLPNYPFDRVYQIRHAERDLLVLVNLAEAARILLDERPDVIVSTGAGPVVPFAVLARLFSTARIVYVETAAAVTDPTLTGRLMYPFAHDFFYQWPALARRFPKGTLRNFMFPCAY